MFIIAIIIFILINILTSILYNYNIIVPNTNSVIQQFLAWLLIVSHDILSSLILILIMICIIQIIKKNGCFIVPLIALNIIAIILIISFLFHKMCVLTIYYNKITNQPYCTPYKSAPSIILNFILRKNNEQKNITNIPSYKQIKCVDNYIGWTDANLINTIIILILNLCVLGKYYINK